MIVVPVYYNLFQDSHNDSVTMSKYMPVGRDYWIHHLLKRMLKRFHLPTGTQQQIMRPVNSPMEFCLMLAVRRQISFHLNRAAVASVVVLTRNVCNIMNWSIQ